ncbi:MAG: UDP-N-acetylglucosamine 1-carboxyvinyltransferase [Planctomycetaceae bacterium]|nr:UDP-N-acetylglucosamine 1-carboxyvinyltransferase [Planctomycetaceae bacterium]
MDMFVVQGGTPLNGRVSVDGAKNSALPIMAASLMIAKPVVLERIPSLVDVATMSLLLTSLGADVAQNGSGNLVIDAASATRFSAHYELVRRMRAGICVLGPLLARFGRACVSLPGGCNIGHRPIDLHLKGLTALGADVQVTNGYVMAEAPRLRGAEICLSGVCGSTVTGTCNVLAAACTAQGRTVLSGAACEPEVVDFGNFLNAAGAQITGLGTSVVEVAGVEQLHEVRYRIIPDRIEAATLAIAAAATRGSVIIEDACPEHMTAVVDALQQVGVTVSVDASVIHVTAGHDLRPSAMAALPYPGIPTDVQAQMMALLTTVPGVSGVTDNVFPDRFMHAAELIRLGADIRRDGPTAVIDGGRPLTGTRLMASDLRASAALVIAALAAEGESRISRIYHLDRGYVRLEDKLKRLGGRVIRSADETGNTTLPEPHFRHVRNPAI